MSSCCVPLVSLFFGRHLHRGQGHVLTLDEFKEGLSNTFGALIPLQVHAIVFIHASLPTLNTARLVLALYILLYVYSMFPCLPFWNTLQMISLCTHTCMPPLLGHPTVDPRVVQHACIPLHLQHRTADRHGVCMYASLSWNTAQQLFLALCIPYSTDESTPR